MKYNIGEDVFAIVLEDSKTPIHHVRIHESNISWKGVEHYHYPFPGGAVPGPHHRYDEMDMFDTFEEARDELIRRIEKRAVLENVYDLVGEPYTTQHPEGYICK